MKKIHLIQISVSNIDKAIKWYCDILGFRVAKRHYHYPVAIDLVHKDKNFRLILHKDKFIDHVYPPGGRTQFGIEVDDIEEALKNLEKKGVEVIHKNPLNFPLGRYAAIKSPDGDIHELVEINGRKKKSTQEEQSKNRAHKK